MNGAYNEHQNANIVNVKSVIAIVSSDEAFLKTISDYLSNHEFLVSAFISTSAAQDSHIHNPCDLVITDLALHSQDSIGFVRKITSGEVSPGILMLSSYADEIERVIALEVGADDVVTKSISPREILARIRAINRRRGDIRSLVSVNQNLVAIERRFTNKDNYLGWSLNLAETTITGPNGKAILLSRAEIQIVAALLKNPKIPLSRRELSSIINNKHTVTNTRHIDTIIARLRRKLATGGGDMFIKTESGVGYYCK